MHSDLKTNRRALQRPGCERMDGVPVPWCPRRSRPWQGQSSVQARHADARMARNAQGDQRSGADREGNRGFDLRLIALSQWRLNVPNQSFDKNTQMTASSPQWTSFRSRPMSSCSWQGGGPKTVVDSRSPTRLHLGRQPAAPRKRCERAFSHETIPGSFARRAPPPQTRKSAFR